MFPLTANPRTVSEADFPVRGMPAEQLRFLLNYAVLAPSEYNAQPWLFRVLGKKAELYIDRSRRLPTVDPDDRETIISCSAACLNLRMALRHFGFEEEVEVVLDESILNLVTCVKITGKREATQEEHQLFYAIPHRRTNRQEFEDRMLPASFLARCESLAQEEGAWLHVVQEEEERRGVAELIVRGDRQQWADKGFRQELSTWLRRQADGSHDGLPGYAGAKGNVAGPAGPWIVRTFDRGSQEVAKTQHLVAGAPVLAVLGTKADTLVDWFAAGQALEKVLLYATSQGIQSSFVNQPVEVSSLRPELCKLIGRKDFPQLVLRMGYASAVLPTPRRSVDQVLLTY